MLGIEEPDDMAMIIFVVCAGMFCVLGIYYIIRGINEKIRHRKNKVEEPGDAADDTRSDGSDDIYTADDESDVGLYGRKHETWRVCQGTGGAQASKTGDSCCEGIVGG